MTPDPPPAGPGPFIVNLTALLLAAIAGPVTTPRPALCRHHHPDVPTRVHRMSTFSSNTDGTGKPKGALEDQ
jgi:hypothetical protein